MWPWSRIRMLEDRVVELRVGLTELHNMQDIWRNDTLKQFEEIRIRLSSGEQTKSEIIKDTDWLTRRKHLTDWYASEGEDFA